MWYLLVHLSTWERESKKRKCLSFWANFHVFRQRLVSTKVSNLFPLSSSTSLYT
ncbi:hypothetical protein RchiOBHm_Chr7g0231061 [Rosa chinensis]|uniref:Uncharacterized protein n=1 Tax=Rosa chinensis TaxID=74649 RepID=A0A2P6PFJ9_ROSCH|nr:hypothetical protein RchiOBHm_Chr7g0231061 [Rosa chinensis]